MEVSVIIPTYKPKGYIYECLESLKKQTLSKELFEVLLVVNGDKEPYYTNIEKWIKDNNLKNFKLFYSEISGVSNARNIALDLSQGEYIAFIDDDDYIDDNYLEELFITNEKLGTDVLIVADQIRFEDKSNKILTKVKYFFKGKSLIRTRKVFSCVWAKMISKNIIKNIRFSTKYKNGEDTLFMLEISKNIKSVKKTRKEIFYYRRVRKDSVCFRKKNKKEVFRNSLSLAKDFYKLLFIKEYDKRFVFIQILSIFKGTIVQLKN